MSVPTNSGATNDSADVEVPRQAPAGVPRETDTAAEKLFGDRLAIAQIYAEALATTGAERGLIGPREVPRIWDRHLLNCVALAELIPADVELADIGSGAGLPGLPIAIARPDVTVYLVEPLLRRVVWLREVVLQLGLSNVEIIRSRANAVAETGRTFDVVTARAVAPLAGLLDLCLPLVRPGGELLAMKGDSAAEELVEAEPTLKQLGAVEWSVAVCGEHVLATPTTVVRVLAGQRPRSSGAAAAAKKAAKGSRPKRPATHAKRPPASGNSRRNKRS
jgi:16S rRNA (guanine527-N7)-methyltransferase